MVTFISHQNQKVACSYHDIAVGVKQQSLTYFKTVDCVKVFFFIIILILISGISIWLKSLLSLAPDYWYVTALEIWSNPITDMSRHLRSEETPWLICHSIGYLKSSHYWYVMASEIWIHPITDMSQRRRSKVIPLLMSRHQRSEVIPLLMSRHQRSEVIPLLICHGIGDLKSSHYWYVMASEIWSHPITDMSRHWRSEVNPLLICHSIGDLK